MEPTANQDNSFDCDPESTVPNPHTKPTGILLNFSYTEPRFSSSEREVIREARALFEGMKCIVFISTFENHPTNCTHK